MSEENTTMDSIRSSASSAARNVADTIDPSNGKRSLNDNKELKTDGQGPPAQKGNFRDQLDRAAFENGTEEERGESTLQKGLGTSEKPQSGSRRDQNYEGKEDKPAGAEPKRPEHDLQVEEFLKEHYKSTSKPTASGVEANGGGE